MNDLGGGEKCHKLIIKPLDICTDCLVFCSTKDMELCHCTIKIKKKAQHHHHPKLMYRERWEGRYFSSVSIRSCYQHFWFKNEQNQVLCLLNVSFELFGIYSKANLRNCQHCFILEDKAKNSVKHKGGRLLSNCSKIFPFLSAYLFILIIISVNVIHLVSRLYRHK